MQSSEFELLDYLSDQDCAYLDIERWVFEGDRQRALGCVSHFMQDGLIAA